MANDLYHNRVLELAADIPNIGELSAPDGKAHKVSRVCGSEVWVEVSLSDDGETITEIAVQSKACALGAATLSVLSEHAVGARTIEVIEARDALRAMLKEGSEPPQGRFWELRHLAGVKDYPQRHQSTLLAFEAAVAAIEDAKSSRAEADIESQDA
ncbi:MAG: iron-sulfur cluster assembly scaffold protein [Ponticaulis sp.]|nr:iron-sulfur cluster assembly scaffold protein [Ponticaulis sp.]|tara:strand:- start:27990 stop:28457 length:468 start_codon:yes stop_codon:yes gene_type:complete